MDRERNDATDLATGFQHLSTVLQMTMLSALMSKGVLKQSDLINALQVLRNDPERLKSVAKILELEVDTLYGLIVLLQRLVPVLAPDPRPPGATA